MSVELALRDLEVFVAVVDGGSFGTAAAQLMISQPAVSERIRHLERVVGRQLFERSARGVTLTAAGEALTGYARRSLLLADEAMEAVRRADGSSSLTVAVHSAFAAWIIPPIADSLRGANIRIRVRDMHSEEVAGLVLDGVADLGFALRASVPRGIRRTELPNDPVVAVAAATHPIAELKRPSMANLTGCLLAVNPWGEGASTFLGRLPDLAVEDWRVRVCGDAATALALARHGDHVAFVARSFLDTIGSPDLQVIPLRGMPRWRIQLDGLQRRSDNGRTELRDALEALSSARRRK